MKSTRDAVVIAAICVGTALVVLHILTGCVPQEAKPALAEATYLAQQLECIDHLETKEDIEGCRESVKRRWARDAGRDAR